MNKIKISKEIEITFKEIIGQYNSEDVGSMVEEISDCFESYECDCNILNQIINIILSCDPVKEELKLLDVDKMKKLLKIIE